MYSEVDAVFTEIHNEIMNDEILMSVLKDAERKGAFLVTASGNVGDGLIHLGAQALLKKLGISIPTVSSTDNLPKNSIVVVVGGAMIEGIWDDRMRDLREHLSRGDKVIFLACSLYGFNAYLSKFKDQIVVFARDVPTYENAFECGVLAYLTHDLAFALPLTFYTFYRPLGNQSLNAFRTDSEAIHSVTNFGNLDLSLLWNGAIWSDLQEVERRCNALAGVVSNYNEINTDRLHLSILSAVLGLKVNLYNTTGGKTAAVFNNSLSKFPNVSFVVSEDVALSDSKEATTELLKYSRELAELRINWYEPELERRAGEIFRLEQSIKDLESRLKQNQLEKARIEHRLISSVDLPKAGNTISLALSNKAAPSRSYMRSLKLVGYALFPP